MQPFVRYLLCSLLITFTGSVVAKDMAGVKIKEVIRLSPETDPIKLNGASTRKKASHSIYVGGLYLQNKTHNLNEILEDSGPKRILLYCKTSSISPKAFVKSFDQGLTINNTPEVLAELDEEISDFLSLWKNNLIHRGDEIWIDYLPEEGTRVSINGEVKTAIKGRAFYNAFLRAWLGKYPVNKQLKNAMLGKKLGKKLDNKK